VLGGHTCPQALVQLARELMATLRGQRSRQDVMEANKTHRSGQ
jgi:hypothetical protein